MKVINKIFLILVFLFLNVSVSAHQNFRINEKIIHPIIIDCLFSIFTCWSHDKEMPEAIYFYDLALDYYNKTVVMDGEYFFHISETKSALGEWMIELPDNSIEFWPYVGYMKYKPILELPDFSYKPNREKFATINDEGGDYSYWLIEAESNGGGSHTERVIMVVELFEAIGENEKSYIRALKIIPFEWIDVKYDSNFEYEDRNQDGMKDIIFYQKTGGTGIQNYVEEIHFFTENKTEVFENEYRTENTHSVRFTPNLDQEIYDLIKKEQPNITYNNNTTREVIFEKGSLPSDNKYIIKTLSKTLFSAEDNNKNLTQKITENYAKNVSGDYSCSSIDGIYTCEVIKYE